MTCAACLFFGIAIGAPTGFVVAAIIHMAAE
jgi:hypothetical protein